MVEGATLNTGAVPKELSSDAGYYSATRPEPEPRNRIPKGLSRRDRMC